MFPVTGKEEDYWNIIFILWTGKTQAKLCMRIFSPLLLFWIPVLFVLGRSFLNTSGVAFSPGLECRPWMMQRWRWRAWGWTNLFRPAEGDSHPPRSHSHLEYRNPVKYPGSHWVNNHSALHHAQWTPWRDTRVGFAHYFNNTFIECEIAFAAWREWPYLTRSLWTLLLG